MSTHAAGTFEVKSFEEDTVEEYRNGGKLSRAHIVQLMAGDLDGELVTDYLMYYRADGTASFVGFQRFTGRLGDHTGGFAQQSIGGYDGAEAHATTFVVAGSGTGELGDVRGKGTSAAPHGSKGTYTLEYDLG